MTTTWNQAALIGGLLSTIAVGAFAHEYKLGELEIGHPWTRATAKGQPTAAGYLSVENNGSTDDRLVSASAPFAEKTELHSMSMDNGVMKMRPVDGGIDLPAGETVKLEPSGLHIMMIHPDQPLVVGTKVPLHLTFEKAGGIDVELAVEKPGAKMGSHDDHGSGEPMQDMGGGS